MSEKIRCGDFFLTHTVVSITLTSVEFFLFHSLAVTTFTVNEKSKYNW